MIMLQDPPGITRAEYIRLRNGYLPHHRRVIFVLESPPKSGLYFYKTDGSVSEPLFRAMMRDVLEINPKSKDEGLREFAARGFLLTDATYAPVNHPHLSKRDRNQLILRDYAALVNDLREHTEPSTELILVKANICELLTPMLAAEGFKILNVGTKIPFPSTGNQNKFRTLVRPLLGLT